MLFDSVVEIKIEIESCFIYDDDCFKPPKFQKKIRVEAFIKMSSLLLGHPVAHGEIYKE